MPLTDAHQVPFVEGNPYSTDPVLPALLKRILPADVFRDVDADLDRFGGEVLTSKRHGRWPPPPHAPWTSADG